jgi:hypothetical protein
MKVNVKNRLADTGTIVLHHPESGLGKTLLHGYLATLPENVTDLSIVLIGHIKAVDEMPLGQQQQVQRRLWCDILDNKDTVILKHLLRRYLTSNDFTENTVFHSLLLCKVNGNIKSCHLLSYDWTQKDCHPE